MCNYEFLIVKAKNTARFVESKDDVTGLRTMSLNTVKQEPEWEDSGESFGIEHGMKPDFNVEVKVEPLCSDDVTASLYDDHVVKDRLVVEPGGVQTQGSNKAALKDCYIRLERITQCASGTGTLSNTRTPVTRHAGATSERPTTDTNTVTYTCDSCGKTFIQKCSIIKHVQFEHTAIKPHKCDICEKRFKQKCHLNRHYRSHIGVKPYACDVCNRKYTRMSNLRNHNCDHTKNIKFYSCEVCNRNFTRKTTLKIHKRIHSLQKPFTCEICNQQYRGNMLRHMKSHTSEMTYSCNICDKKFSRLSNLNEHVDVHSGKKYSCTVCGKQLARLRTLKDHEKKYHS